MSIWQKNGHGIRGVTTRGAVGGLCGSLMPSDVFGPWVHAVLSRNLVRVGFDVLVEKPFVHERKADPSGNVYEPSRN